MNNTDSGRQAKVSAKTLEQKIDVVAEFHAHRIVAERIAYRTGIDLQLIVQLLEGSLHQRQFKRLLGQHRKSRRDQRLKKSLRVKGIAQANLQDSIEADYANTISDSKR